MLTPANPFNSIFLILRRVGVARGCCSDALQSRGRVDQLATAILATMTIEISRYTRCFKCTVTRLPASFPMALRTSVFIGNMCLPSPMAMNELWNGHPSIVPRTFTRPRVPKNLTESGQTTYVQPPFLRLFCSLAVNVLFSILVSHSFDRWRADLARCQ